MWWHMWDYSLQMYFSFMQKKWCHKTIGYGPDVTLSSWLWHKNQFQRLVTTKVNIWFFTLDGWEVRSYEREVRYTRIIFEDFELVYSRSSYLWWVGNKSIWGVVFLCWMDEIMRARGCTPLLSSWTPCVSKNNLLFLSCIAKICQNFINFFFMSRYTLYLSHSKEW